MEKIFDKIVKFIEYIIAYKKKIIKIGVFIVSIVVALVIVLGGVYYSYAKSNIKYSKNEAEGIALKKIQGEVVDFEKDLDFEDATFEYKFEIKDKENMLKEITVSSKSGAITDIENPYEERYDD